MRCPWILATLIAALPGSALPGQDSKSRWGLGIWDTGQPSGGPFAPAALTERSGWTPVADAGSSFKGDAVLANGRALVVVRRQSPAVEIYATGVEAAVSRARIILQAAGNDPAARLDRVVVAENTKGVVSAEATYNTSKGAGVSAKFRLKKGDLSVEVEPGPGAARLRVECPTRYVVLPDFFADDMVIDAARIPIPAIEIPSENFLLHLTGKGDSIAMCAFENREQDVKLTFAGEGEKRTLAGTEVAFGDGKKNGKVWLALMEGPFLWYAAEVKAGEAKKVLPIDWKMPFLAQWRCDFTRANDLTDSWEMLIQETKGGEYLKPEWMDNWSRKIPPNRERWNPMLGRFSYPCWTDDERKGFLQPFDRKGITHRGPVVIYPIHRIPKTPVDAYTVVDVVRNTLGVGPCQYILDLEGQKDDVKGTNTCSVRDAFAEIWAKGEQKQKRSEILKSLDDGLAFVTHIRKRIELYVEFDHQLRALLADQKRAHPELAKPIDELDEIAAQMDARYAARREHIHTPAYVAALNEEFRKSVLDYEGPDAAERSKKYTAALVEVGDNQDELSGECRWIVKNLRQKAGILLALDPLMAPVAEEIRSRTQKVLRSPAGLERAHH